MSDKIKGTALPSFLSNIRNAGRASAATSGPMGGRKTSFHEMRSLMMEFESDLESNEKRSQSQYNARVNNLTTTSQNFSRFVKDKLRKGTTRGRRRFNRNQGFAVQLPPKVLVYTILIFFVLPLLMGSIFVVRAIFFDELKEDEMHPLHKKAKIARMKHDNPSGDLTANIENNANATMEGDIISDHVQVSNPLLDVLKPNGILENTSNLNNAEENEDTNSIQNIMDTGNDENVHFIPGVTDPLDPDDMTPKGMTSDTELMKLDPLIPDQVALSNIGNGEEEIVDEHHTSDTQNVINPNDSQISETETVGVDNSSDANDSALDIIARSVNTTAAIESSLLSSNPGN